MSEFSDDDSSTMSMPQAVLNMISKGAPYSSNNSHSPASRNIFQRPLPQNYIQTAAKVKTPLPKASVNCLVIDDEYIESDKESSPKLECQTNAKDSNENQERDSPSIQYAANSDALEENDSDRGSPFGGPIAENVDNNINQSNSISSIVFRPVSKKPVNEFNIFQQSLQRQAEISKKEQNNPPPESRINKNKEREALLRKKLKREMARVFEFLGLHITDRINTEIFGTVLSHLGVALYNVPDVLQDAFSLANAFSNTSSPQAMEPEVSFFDCVNFMYLVFGVSDVVLDENDRALIAEVQIYRHTTRVDSPLRAKVAAQAEVNLSHFAVPNNSAVPRSASNRGEMQQDSAPKAKSANSNQPSVFDRLHSDVRKKDTYKTKDSRTSEQKIIEEHCSFTPKLVAASPFMSPRALRTTKSRYNHHGDGNDYEVDSMEQMFSSHASNRSQSGAYKASDKHTKPHASPKSGFSPFFYFRGDIEEIPPWDGGDSGQEAVQSEGGANITPDYSNYQGGLFIPGFGLIRGPPASAGIPLFHFNPLFPPSFELGSYLTNSTVVITQPVSEESSGEESVASAAPEMAAPPLPSWALGPGGDPERTKTTKTEKPAITIVKKAPQEKKTEATGWQKVMEEFAARRGSMSMKKVQVEEKKPVGKLKKGGKKKEGFNDIIDELSHRLARMRGEIVDDDDDDDEPSAPAPAPAPKSAAKPPPTKPVPPPPKGSEPAVVSSSSSDPGPNYKAATPPCTSIPPPPALNPKHPLLSSLPPSVAVAAPAAAPAAVPAKPVLQLPFGPPGGQAAAVCTHPIAVAKPAALPAPPPLPAQWPPAAPFVLPKGAGAKKKKRNSQSKRRKSRKSFQATSTVVTTSTKLLPGYYTPSPDFNSVPAGEVQPAGFTTPEMCEAPKPRQVQGQGQAQGGQGQGQRQVGKPANGAPGVAGPSPAKGGPTVARRFVPQFNIKQAYTKPASLALNDPATVSNHSVGEFIETGDSNSVASSHNSRSVKRIVVEDLPLPTNFHASIQRMQLSNKRREERLEKEKEVGLRQYSKPPAVSRNEKTIPKDFESNVTKRLEAKAHSYRKPVERSQADHLPQSQRIPTVTSSAKMVGIDDTSSSYFLSTLRDEQPKLEPKKSNMVYSRDYEDRTYSEAPTFYHTYGVERRVSERTERQKQELSDQRARQQGIKAYKEHLHQQAIQSAVMTGTYNPNNSSRSHDKILAKYGNSPAIDMQSILAAKRQYMEKHSLSEQRQLIQQIEY